MVDTMYIMNLLLKCYKYAEYLKQVFQDDTLCSILQTIGGVEYKSAREAINVAKESNNAKMLIGEAIGHLRTAYISCIDAANKRRLWGILPAKSETRVKSYKLAIDSLLLMSLCYKGIYDNKNALDVLHQVDKILPAYEKALLDKVMDDARPEQAAINMQGANGSLISDDQSDLDDRIEEDENNARQKVQEIKTMIYKIQESI